MAIDLATALSRYGFVGQLANSIPELRALFGQAAREEWDPLRFQQAVMDSRWWKSHSEASRQLLTLKVTDPATYASNVKNATIKVQLISQQLGLKPLSQADYQRRAVYFLSQNYDDETIRSWLASNTPLAGGPGAGYFGSAAEYETHLRELATNYGVPVTTKWLNDQVTGVLAGRNTVDGVESQLRAKAKATFPQFAEQIDAGLTVRDIADPYISTMANTLEIGETDIDLSDPWIKKALTNRTPGGVVDALPLWQFERQLKDDPRWDKTKQARTQAFDTISQIGRDFGFVA